MMKWSWVLTSVLLAAGCSAGGSGGSSVETQQGPGSLSPGGGTPAAGGGATPVVNTGNGQLFEEPDEAPSDECDSIIQVLFRDFSDAHPDFEMDFAGDGVRLNLIAPRLGADDKPTFASSVGCAARQGEQVCRTDYNVDRPVITSAATFDQWYRTIPGVNQEFPKPLELLETAPDSGLYRYSSNDFFPLAPTDGFGETPPGRGKNFLFTTEIHLTFGYVRGQRFTFQGDDDLWIFVNKRLALDLGSMHGVEAGTIDFDARAAELEIVAGSVYSMDIFHAERHTNASNFTIETNIACFTPGALF